jgi:hypothetical protein
VGLAGDAGLFRRGSEGEVAAGSDQKSATRDRCQDFSQSFCQARPASERRLKPTYFNREDLMKHVASKLVLSVDTPNFMLVVRD